MSDSKDDGRRVQNRPYDEAIDLEASLDESVETHVNMSQSIVHSPPGRGHTAGSSGGHPGAGGSAPFGGERGDSPPRVEESEPHAEYAGSGAEIPGGGHSLGSGGMEQGDISAPLAGEGAVSTGGAVLAGGGYNPAEFAGLPVSEDIRGLFKYITSYNAHDIKLETQLKPFVPDFIPSVGDMDAFLKPARPDGAPEHMGLEVVDEPAANQSDPTVLDLQLRALSKKSNLQPTHVRSIEHASRNEREVTKWISSIADLHRTKPAPQVHYTKSMPDVDKLMEAWPAAFDAWLSERKGAEGLPTAGMDLSLEEFARVACGLLDVPVYPGSESSLIQSMHALLTTYHEFKTNPHFQQQMGAGEAAAPAGGFMGGAAAEGKWDGM